MRTRLLAGLALFVLVLSACGESETPEVAESPEDGGGATTEPADGDTEAATDEATGEATDGATAGDGGGVVEEGPEITFRLATSKPPGDPNIVALEGVVAEQLSENSGGRFTLEVFPGDELGTSTDQIERASSGEIEMTFFNPAITSSLSSHIGVFAAPYVHNSYEEVYAAINSEAGQQAFQELIDVHRLRPISTWYLGGWIILTRDAPVQSCEDLQGIQVRTPPAPVMQDFMERCGAGVVSMTFSEVHLALQTGVIGGLPTPLPFVDPAGLAEVTSYGTTEPFLYEVIQPLINEDLWQSLSPEDQEIITAAFDAGREESDQAIFDLEAAAVDHMVESGMEVVEDVDHDSFRAAAEGTWERFVEDWGGQEAFEAIRQAGSG